MPQPIVRPRRALEAPPPRTELTPHALAWDEAVEAFFADCRRRNLSTETITGVYAWVLRGERIRQFRADHTIRKIEQFDADMLRTFEEELVASGLAPRSVSIFHRTLKTFAFCIDREFLTDEKILRVKGPRLPQDHPVGFTAEEERRLLIVAERYSQRDRVLLEFMLRTGLRLSEVSNLTVDDIVEAPEGSFVRVRQGKGRKDRIVPLDSPGHSLSKTLRHYLRNVRPHDTRQRGVWLSHKKIGKDGDYTTLSPNGIEIMFKRISAYTGIHAFPHRCRHHFATRSLAAGLNPLALQRALGHTTMAMTSRYVSASEADLLDAWRHRRD